MTVSEVNNEKVPFKYKEDEILDEVYDFIASSYNLHYVSDEEKIQCFDAWIAMGSGTSTFRDTAMKYLWRYGKKEGNNKKDLLKAMHYIILMIYNDHKK